MYPQLATRNGIHFLSVCLRTKTTKRNSQIARGIHFVVPLSFGFSILPLSTGRSGPRIAVAVLVVRRRRPSLFIFLLSIISYIYNPHFRILAFIYRLTSLINATAHITGPTTLLKDSRPFHSLHPRLRMIFSSQNTPTSPHPTSCIDSVALLSYFSVYLCLALIHSICFFPSHISSSFSYRLFQYPLRHPKGHSPMGLP
jgi:hypothetical protein